MAEKIVNGHFYGGTDPWSNGVDGGYPYTWRNHDVYGESNAADTAQKTFKIEQSFSSADEVITALAKIWAGGWGASGNVSNGTATLQVALIKPDTSSVILYEGGWTGDHGEGYGLNDLDIKAHFTAYGSYKLSLILIVNSAKSTNSVNLSTGSGSAQGQSDGETYEIELSDSFYLPVEAYSAPISVWGGGSRYAHPGSIGHATVYLDTPTQGTKILYDGDMPGSYNVFSITGDCGWCREPGTYTLRLHGWANSVYAGGVWHNNIVTFGGGNLTANYYAYSKSSGNFDDAQIKIAARLYKTVMEAIGGGEAKQIKEKFYKSEAVALAESYTKNVFIPKVIAESLGLGESYNKKISMFVLEAIGLSEFYATKQDLLKTLLEQVGLGESYSKLLICPISRLEKVGLRESLRIKRTAGNVETTFNVTDLGQWITQTPPAGAWNKERTEILKE